MPACMFSKEFRELSLETVALRNCFIRETLEPAGIYLLKVNNRNTKTRCEVCSKLTRKTPENISHLVLVFLLLTLNR